MYSLQLERSFVPPQTDEKVREITVGKLLHEVARIHPNDIGLVEVDEEGELTRRWTYDRLLYESLSIASSLVTRFSPGERVTIWAPNIPEWLLMEYACAHAGLILVTANPAYQVRELRYVLEQSGSVALFFVDEFRSNPMAAIAMEATSGLGDIREVVHLKSITAIKQIEYHSSILPNVDPADAAQIQYTSGTTGFPKGALLSHRGLVNNARFYAGRAKTHKSTIWANVMPMFHTTGCSMISLGCLQAGAKMLMVKQFNADVLACLMESESVTSLMAVPTMLMALLESLEKSPRDMSSVEMVTSGGAMVAPELVRRVKKNLGCDFETVFGQTETSPVVTQHHITDSIEDICNTIGQPLPQTGVSIRSLEENEVVPIGTVGEICTLGYGNMIAYHANEIATRETIDAEGWLHTGDLGEMDVRGYLKITGRVKDMIIRGGENYFPAEIENILLEHPSVAEAVVVGLPDAKWGEIIACFIRPADGQVFDSSVLRQHCRKHLAPQKTPVKWCQVNAYPQTGSGKIQKYILREKYLSGEYEMQC